MARHLHLLPVVVIYVVQRWDDRDHFPAKQLRQTAYCNLPIVRRSQPHLRVWMVRMDKVLSTGRYPCTYILSYKTDQLPIML